MANLNDAISEFCAAEQYTNGYRVGVVEDGEGGYTVYVADGLMPPHHRQHVASLADVPAALTDMEIDANGWTAPEEF